MGESHKEFILYTPYYISPHAERNEENLYCLRKNLENPLISKVVLINEEKALPFEHPKLTHIHSVPRPTFAQIFAEIAKQKRDNTIRILANSDIYFDDTLEKALCIKSNEVYALTRWDLQQDGSLKFFLKFHSQDAWIFTSDLDKSIGDFPMGQPGCDNRLAYELKKTGYKVLNPSFSIVITHVHASGFRPYLSDNNAKIVDGNYAYLLPTYLGREISKEKQGYFYIRYEYFLNKFKGTLTHSNFTALSRLLSVFPTFYYLVLFKISQSLNKGDE